MERRRVRIGDVIDDYCTRCRLIMNHGVAAMVGDDIRKVRCNTCMSEHVYKHGRVPARKRRETEKLFAEVLRGLGREPDDPAADAPVEDVAAPDDGAEEDDQGAIAEARAPDVEAEATGEVNAETNAAAAGDAQPPDAEPERPADALHGVRRKLYTIRNFSGGKAPPGGGPTDGSVGGAPTGGPMGRDGRHDGGGRPHGGGRHRGGRPHGGRRRGGGGRGDRRGR